MATLQDHRFYLLSTKVFALNAEYCIVKKSVLSI